jgi:ABC-type cobalamin/Fe3+-siderophores transport system ATPase subunit
VTPDDDAHGHRTASTANWMYSSNREEARRLAVLPQGLESPTDLTVRELTALGR